MSNPIIEGCSDVFDMQLIGNFLSFASRGDRVGLNQMLMGGISPNVQDYDKRTALHLAASEGHASIVELLLAYQAEVNLQDRWQRTLLINFLDEIKPLTDAKLYGHRDICRILEVNGGKDSMDDHAMTIPHEEDSNEVKIEMSELDMEHSSTIDQGLFGESELVKWRGTWVVKTTIQRHICHPVKMILSAKDNTLLMELRHPNILQFLGSVVHDGEMILITEYLSKGNLNDILVKRTRLDPATALRYALDIARGMNYLHQHKPFPIVHNNLNPRNLLQDEGGHLKIGEYWIQMLYEHIHTNQDHGQQHESLCTIISSTNDTKKDVLSFGLIFYQMLEGRLISNDNVDGMNLKFVDSEKKFHLNRCPGRILQLIENCVSNDPSERPTFEIIITVLEEVSSLLGKAGCPVCGPSSVMQINCRNSK